jgi:autotransporter adhesin
MSVRCRGFRRGQAVHPAPLNSDDYLNGVKISDGVVCNSTVDNTIIQNSQLINVTGTVTDSNHNGTGIESTVVGLSASSGGDRAVGFGWDSVSTGDDSVALGHAATSTTTGAIAIGAASSATAAGSISIGALSDVSGAQSIVLSTDDVDVSGLRNVYIGNHFTSLAFGGDDSIVVGSVDTLGDRSVIVGNVATTGTGTSVVMIGMNTNSTGDETVIIGNEALGSTTHSIAIGSFAQATGSGAIAIGGQSSTTFSPLASGSSSIAIGRQSKATATNTIAIGLNARAQFPLSVSIGQSCHDDLASAGGVVIGANCTALGGFGFLSLGTSCQAGFIASAIGYSAIASHNYSFVCGHNIASVADDTWTFGTQGTRHQGFGPRANVTQATSLATAVTVDALHGVITLFSAIGAGATANFTVNNARCDANSIPFLTIFGGITGTNYTCHLRSVAAGNFAVSITNNGGVTGVIPRLCFMIVGTHS